MKTSPELLSSILQVLTKIEKKMGGESAEPKPAFSDLITGKRSLKDVFKKKPSVEENTIKALSLGVEQLNKELGKVDIEKLKSISNIPILLKIHILHYLMTLKVLVIYLFKK